MRIQTRETVLILETYLYDLGDFDDAKLPDDFDSMSGEQKANWLNRNCADIERIDWEYAGSGSIEEYEVI